MKLNITFYNPNTIEETIEMLIKMFVEANKERVEKLLINYK